MYTVTDIAPTDAEFTALIAALDAWQETPLPGREQPSAGPRPAAARDSDRPGDSQSAGRSRWLRGHCPQR